MEGFRCPSIARRAYLRHVILYAPRTPLSAADNKCYDLFSLVRQRKCISSPRRISAFFSFPLFPILKQWSKCIVWYREWIYQTFLLWVLDTLIHFIISPLSSFCTTKNMYSLITWTPVRLILTCSFTKKKKNRLLKCISRILIRGVTLWTKCNVWLS